MNQPIRTQITRDEDHTLLGFVVQSGSSWEAQTVFGYRITRTESRAAAENVVREQGLNFLGGVWQYYDEDDNDWHHCVLKEANPHHVTVVRTTPLGFQDPDNYKRVMITEPSETNLIKA